MSDNPLLIEIKNLKTHFMLDEGVVKAVDGATFDIRQGETLGVVGESGCGKSVIARSLLRIVDSPGRIVGGEILFHRVKAGPGAPVLDLAKLDPSGPEIRAIRGAEIAMIFQEPMTSLSPIYTIGNQIIEALDQHQTLGKKAARGRAIELLRHVGMPMPERQADAYPHQLSGGMRQRAMIAMALSCQPSLLIADEPTTALDVTTQAQILQLLVRLKQEEGMGIVMITHDLGVIAEIAQNVVVMYLGRVAEVTDVRSLFHDAKHPYTQAFLQSIPKVGRKARTPLRPVIGMIPSPYNRPKGCLFHPRCPQFMKGTCDVLEPSLTDVGPGHKVSCLLYGEKG